MSTATTTTINPAPHAHPHQLPPAYLWLGPHEALVAHTVTFLQTQLCAHGGCRACRTCTQIGAQQHHAVMWLLPEKNYTLEDLSGIFSSIAFSLDPDDHFFFVIQKADYLSDACSNKLLKSIEEPPQGYHFILLTERLDDILPTIRSRCIMQTIKADPQASRFGDLFDHFATPTSTSASAFSKALDQSKINEQESIELLDSLLRHWLARSSQLLIENKKDEYQGALRIIAHLKKAFEMPPMPGSSKIFWKNLFMQMKG